MKSLQDCVGAYSGPVDNSAVQAIVDAATEQAFNEATAGGAGVEVFVDAPEKTMTALVAALQVAGFTVDSDYPFVRLSGWADEEDAADSAPAAQDSSASTSSTDAQSAAAQPDSTAPDATSLATSPSADSTAPTAPAASTPDAAPSSSAPQAPADAPAAPATAPTDQSPAPTTPAQ